MKDGQSKNVKNRCPGKTAQENWGGGPPGKTSGCCQLYFKCWGICFGVRQIARAASQDALVRSKGSESGHGSDTMALLQALGSLPWNASNGLDCMSRRTAPKCP